MLLMLLRLCWLPGSDVSVSGIPGLSYLVEQPLVLLLIILLFGLVCGLGRDNRLLYLVCSSPPHLVKGQ